jgi:hypothetical protein
VVVLQNQLAELAVVLNPLGQIGVGNTGNLNVCGKPLAMVRCCTAIHLGVDKRMPEPTELTLTPMP